MPIIPPGYLNVALKYASNEGARDAVMTHGCLGTVDSLDEILARAETLTIGAVTDSWTLESVTIAGPAGTLGTVTSGQSGGRTGGVPLPPQVCAIVRKTTATPGRKGRGRFYVPAPDESDVNGAGVLTVGAIIAISNAFEAYRAGMDTDGNTMVVLHNSAGDPDVITVLTCETQTGTQRRRNRK